MKSFIEYFIKTPIAANLLMVGLFIMGIVGLFNMKSTFFPEVERREIFIQVVYPGASPEEIEEGVVQKIEENLKGLTGVERYTSVSQENSATVTVEVLRDYDPDLILQDVKNAVDRISSFPADMEPLVVYKNENIDLAVSFALTGTDDLKTLKRFGRQVEEDFRKMEGISQVELTGFPEEEIEIAFREQDLEAYDITFNQATLAVRNANLEVTGGTIKGKEEELLLRARNKSYFAEGLRNIVVKTGADGSVIRLHQIADLNDQWADDPNRSFINGQPAVVVSVNYTIEEDILSIADKVNAYIQDFNDTHETIQATQIRDRSIVLRQRIDLLTENGIIGFGLVLILLAMFLNWRIAFWVALAIPISFAGMFIFAYLLDVTINVISLFGMILVIGILVDDGIVISESIYQEHEKGLPRFQAAIRGTMKVLPAVFTAILTTVIAFSSFFFIDGTLGDFFSQMALVVILSLVFSLVEGALILPAHVAHSKALAQNHKEHIVAQKLEAGLFWLRDKLYGPSLKFCMQHKWFTLAGTVGLFIITIGSIFGGIIRTTFFPDIERDSVVVTLQMPAGTREGITLDWLRKIEEAAWRANEQLSKEFFDNEKQAVDKVQINLGPTSYQGTLDIALLDSEERDPLEIIDVVNAVRRETGAIPEAEILTFGASSIFGKAISVSLVGSDTEQVDAAANEVKQALKELAELSDVIDSNQEGLREINIELTEKGKYLGLNLGEVIGQVRSAFFGSEAQRLQRGQDEVRVWVRYTEDNRRNIDQLKDMRIRLSDGREFPLSEIATLNIERGITAINHIDGKREIKVEADKANKQVSVSDITDALKTEIIPEILAHYPGVTAQYEGQNRQQAKTQRSLQIVMPVVFLLMFFSIALTFRSISQTLAVFALIPFGFIGAAWGHWLIGLPISLFSALGLIALIGILVNDALVFVTTYNDNIEEGMDHMEAVYETGLSRFRPILLTSVTTVAGLLPLLLEKSVQAQFLIPMAISVAFGLILVTFIILVLLPVLLIISNRIKQFAHILWDGRKPGHLELEPATAGYHSQFFLYLIAALLALGIFGGIIYGMFQLSAAIT